MVCGLCILLPHFEHAYETIACVGMTKAYLLNQTTFSNRSSLKLCMCGTVHQTVRLTVWLSKVHKYKTGYDKGSKLIVTVDLL